MKSPAARLFALVAIALLTLLPSTQAQTTAVLTTLHSFTGAEGNDPESLVQGRDGNFYGTTYSGGSSGYGTVFSITPAGALTTLHNFTGSGTDGSDPLTTLVQGRDGNFYGTTYIGGTNSDGTVFSITPAGVLTTLYSFNFTDGELPHAGLVQGSDGNFYGTTYQGGSGVYGTVFSITPAGVLTTLHNFAKTDGGNPEAPLVQGTDGNFYGTTNIGGNSNFGTIFSITPAGVFTTLHSFTGTGTDGKFPANGLVQGSDGNFYGTTVYGGSGTEGTVFSITPAGVLTTLYSFTGTGTDGANPSSSLVHGSDGDFYGTTLVGGSTGEGTVFSITPAGVLTTLHGFIGSDGTGPVSLIQASDGNFYGATEGGSSTQGSIFKLSLAPAAPTAPVVQFAADTYNTTENAGTVSVVLNRTGDTSAPINLTYMLGGTAINGTDYQALTGTLTFNAGKTTASIDVFPLDHGVSDGSTHTLTLTLAPAADGSYTIGTPATATVNILENDAATTPTTIAITSPPDGAVVAPGQIVPFAASILDPSGLFARVQITVNGLPVYSNSSAGPYVTNVTVPPGAATYVVKATVTDTNGDQNTSTITVHSVVPPTGATPPTSAVLTPVNGLDLAAGSTLTFSFTAASASNTALAKVSLYADGTLVAAFDGSGNQLLGIPGDHPVRFDASSGRNVFQTKYTLPAADKLVNMIAVAVDALGLSNISTVASLHSKVTSDKAPLVALGGVTSGTHFNAGVASSATVTASDPDAVSAAAAQGGLRPADASANAILAKIIYFLNGNNIGENDTATPPFAFNFTPTVGGKNVLHAVATDGSGLSTVSEPVVVEVDVATPTVDLAVSGTGMAVEGGAPGIVLVTRTGDTTVALTVNYKVKGSAIPGVDYKKLSGTVIIPAGAAKAKIKVKPISGSPNKDTLKVKVVLLPPADGSYLVGTSPAKIKLIGK